MTNMSVKQGRTQQIFCYFSTTTAKQNLLRDDVFHICFLTPHMRTHLRDNPLERYFTTLLAATFLDEVPFDGPLVTFYLMTSLLEDSLEKHFITLFANTVTGCYSKRHDAP